MGGALSIPKYFGRDYSQCTLLKNPEKKRIGGLEYWWRSLTTTDYQSAVAVACVSLPLSVALAIQSGAAPSMGLQAAMYGPMIQGVLGGSEYNILGPAGALVGILQGFAVNHGVAILPYIAMLSGIMMFFCSIFRAGEFCLKIENEPAVLEGFSGAVAATIGLGQLNSIFGIEGLKRKAMFHQNFGSSLDAIFTNTPGKDKYCAWYTDDKTGTQEWRCSSGFQWAEFVGFLVAFTALCEFSQNTGKGMVLGTTIGAKLNNEGKSRKPWLLFLALIGILIGVIFENTVNKDVDDQTRKTESHFPLLLRHKYPAMSTMEADKVMFKTDHFDYSFTWESDSNETAKTLSIIAIFIGALEVAFVAVLETVVSAILGQQKKCRFSGRTEMTLEDEDVDGSVAAPLEDDVEAGTLPTGKTSSKVFSEAKKDKSEDEETDVMTTDPDDGEVDSSAAMSYEVEQDAAQKNSANVAVAVAKDTTEPLPPIPPFLPTNEVFGISVANFVSGFCGGVPCTGVLLRTEVNCSTGAESKASQWFNGVIVLVVSCLLLQYFAYLPFFIIAAMLTKSAIGLGQSAQGCVKNDLLPQLRKAKESGEKKDLVYAYFDFCNFAVVLLVCLFIDGAIGLSVGFIGKYICWKCVEKCMSPTDEATKKPAALSNKA